METVERDVVRAVVLDSHDHVLLFHTRDPTYPELGTWWELPGGGIDPGETFRTAAVRELAEEAGLVVTPDQVGEPGWRRRPLLSGPAAGAARTVSRRPAARRAVRALVLITRPMKRGT